uniref:Uncharacterized protein n=1 Tax=Spongospora subterranea TaxID=70186 RepID=A0A0H5RBN7_9EUKA|eukprot:CRZ11635.1 hypothetical protein [Spongospora subterranea]
MWCFVSHMVTNPEGNDLVGTIGSISFAILSHKDTVVAVMLAQNLHRKGITSPVKSCRSEAIDSQKTTLCADEGSLYTPQRQRQRSSAKLIVSRLCSAVFRMRTKNRPRHCDMETIQSMYMADDHGPEHSRSSCDITIPNSVSITPELVSTKKFRSPGLNELIPATKNPPIKTERLIHHSDYLATLGSLTADDRLLILRRAAKQYTVARRMNQLRIRSPSLAASRQYFTLYHVQTAVELCQYQIDQDFFPAPGLYRLEHGIDCLSHCWPLDRFLLHCDVTRSEYEQQWGLLGTYEKSKGSRDLDLGTIKQLEVYRRRLDQTHCREGETLIIYRSSISCDDVRCRHLTVSVKSILIRQAHLSQVFLPVFDRCRDFQDQRDGQSNSR